VPETRPLRQALLQTALFVLYYTVICHAFLVLVKAHAMSTEEEAIAYRDQVNWRSVSRADPSVQQMLNTCSFCSVFIYDKVKDGWVKQNQEGSLFLVRRYVYKCYSPSCHPASVDQIETNHQNTHCICLIGELQRTLYGH
jgi:hypothetical protein